MIKKKQKKIEQYRKTARSKRLDTEADIIPHKESKTRADFQQRFDVQEQMIKSSRLKLKSKELEKIFISIKNILDSELDDLLTGKQYWEIYQVLMQSQLFRVRKRGKAEICEELSKIIQALELLYSKLHNNQSVKDAIYVRDESELLLFFKHLFGKPYTVCNYPNFRKVLNTIWQHQMFKSFDPKKMVDHLRQWCVGIEYPLNPASIPIHKLVFLNPGQIKKYALLLSNSVTYCHIDSGDCMGLTPLLLAAHCNKPQAYEQIIKSGANLYRCPLTFSKNTKIISSSKKHNKQMIQIKFPLYERKQLHIFQLLSHHRHFQSIVNIISLNEVHKLKRMKKTHMEIRKKIKQIPDCCLQIHWKTYKGFFSFKQLPKDVITIFKKDGSLRIDFHVDDIQQVNGQQKHYSILIKTGKQEDPTSKLEYYYINHHSKKITNLMKQILQEKLKQRYEQITQLGSIQQQYITNFKSATKSGETQSMQVTAEFVYENLLKGPLYSFKDLTQYQRGLFQSNTIDYSILQESETRCTMKQNVGQMPKVKSKTIKNCTNVKIDWINEKINLKQISYILSILDKKSSIFVRISKLFDVLLFQQPYSKIYQDKLPVKMIIDIGSDFSLQMQIKNLTYMILDDAAFGLQFRTKKMSYEEQGVGLQSLKQTMIMQESYSINMSRFLGQTQELLQEEEREANRKFEQLLSKEISGQISDQQDGSLNQQLKINSQRNVLRQNN